MNKKHVLSVLLVLMLAASMVLVSCGGANIAGTWVWEITRAEFAEIEGASDEDLAMVGFPEKWTMLKIVFSEDGRFTAYSVNPKDGTESEEDSGTYTVSGNKVTFGDLTGTISGGTITIEDEEASMVLKKQ